MKQVMAMKHPLFRSIFLLSALVLGLSTGPLWAADTKGKLPAAKPADPTVTAKVKEPPKGQAQDAKGADRFIDKDNNGVDDRHETKVIRQPDAEKPPVAKKEVPPPPAVTEPPTKAPPGR
jgi:hypothetical protein